MPKRALISINERRETIGAALTCIRLPSEARAAMIAAMRWAGMCRSRSGVEFTIDPNQAERLIVLRIYDASWDVIYDGATKDIVPGQHKPGPNKIVVRKAELDRLGKPDTWKRFWHIKGRADLQ
jgi:hypothetical protein